ncbi:TlyA family rRNA (cytidine-2'-O)-methyltransferase [Hydrococcus rivularis NIES-593]|uniref:TlyA family rRNA (Cytidine-2'-O)-methyltransferase n=1 Tax=Hydrococcus rivularis NIES-593 TaxID=1921803 RepID=A0A1U7HEZ4_9CYAN|nr:TlyA family RNA methyltransferase [Hydrococcus rivularis]OKH22167.1 TlyA family rRNA (cytidine-2'-O)-methyltransferase [Hydrococcus rivularis NIES-593]
MVKQRLDTLLVNLNLCDSRQQAQRLIRAGEVKVNEQVIDKPGTEVDDSADIQVQQKPKYVSRGGQKLESALKVFQIPVEGRICLDGGISTGGFTDCLLKAGAKRVYGVDVGYGQVAWSLRQDERVVLKERTNFRYLTYEDLYGDEPPADLGVMDLSFISLTKVLEPLWNLLVPPREVILLVKPQFEVGRERVGKKGVVRNAKDRAEAIYQVLQAAQNLGWRYRGLTPSPITGPEGNIEYLLWLSMEGETRSPDLQAIQKVAEDAIAPLGQ